MAAQIARSLIALAVVAAFAAGCGADDPASSAKRSDKLVDFSKKPPFVNAMVPEPDGSFLLTTNKGFFRVKQGKEPERIRGTVNDSSGSSPVGTFLEIDQLSPTELVGSGHPDNPRPLPPYLGYMRSTDAGKTWKIVSRLGEADLHQIRRIHNKIYAFDAVLGAILVSTNGGKDWEERFTPRELILDFVVDPEDENHILASSAETLYRTTDGGNGWRPAMQVKSARLAWPEKDVVLRADRDGSFQVSDNGGETFRKVGRLPGEPYKVVAKSKDEAFVALSDGAIYETTDGGKSFENRYQP
jgi:hypothetical protein